MSFHELFSIVLEPQKLIAAFGLIGILLIIFAETGLFFGFFLPGDSLLFTAGFLASQGHLPFIPLVVGVCAAAIVGDSVGYWFGKKTGPALFSREDSRFFKKKYAERARTFYETQGKKTIILARFIPIIRTFAPIVAGIGKMEYRVFIAYNVIGGFIWSVGLTLAGYFLGRVIPSADKYLLPIIAVIIIISFVPVIIEYVRSRRSAKDVHSIE